MAEPTDSDAGPAGDDRAGLVALLEWQLEMGADEAIGLTSPPTPPGARGLRSNMSWVGGPP